MDNTQLHPRRHQEPKRLRTRALDKAWGTPVLAKVSVKVPAMVVLHKVLALTVLAKALEMERQAAKE